MNLDRTRNPIPEVGRLRLTDDESVEHLYLVTHAEFSIYEQGGQNWLTLFVRADQKIAPKDGENPEPFLELNLPFASSVRSALRPGATIAVPSYCEEHFNLTDLYYWSHRPFDGEMTVESASSRSIIALLVGESAGDAVALHAAFRYNSDLRRSLD